MINKITLTLGSALTIALTSFGLWSARQLVEREPYCYFDEMTGFNSFNYADTYILLIIGVGVGIGLATIIRTLTD